MAIYNEDQDPNEVVKSAKELHKESVIDDINGIISEFGSFTVADVQADHSPILSSKGRLTTLVEEFYADDTMVYVYDPSSHCSDEIDSYNEHYENIDIEQLEYILELAQKWVEINEE